MSRLATSLGGSFHISNTHRVVGVLEIKVTPKSGFAKALEDRGSRGIVAPDQDLVLRHSWAGLDRLLLDDREIRRAVKELAARNALHELLNLQAVDQKSGIGNSVSQDLQRFSARVKPTITLSFADASFDDVREIIADNVPLARTQRYLMRTAAMLHRRASGKLSSITVTHAPNFDVTNLQPVKGVVELGSKLTLGQLPQPLLGDDQHGQINSARPA